MNEIEKRSIIIRWLKQRTKESYKYWYYKCSDHEKKVYKEILLSLVNLSDNVNISFVRKDDLSSINELYDYCIKDNPIIFYLEKCTFTIYNNFLTLNYVYGYDLNEIYKIIAVIDTALRKLVKRCCNKNDIEKEKIVHDCIVRQVIYQKNCNFPIHSCHSVFMHKAAVCDGISKAVKLMLDHVGVRAFVVNGEAVSQEEKSESGGHAWNMVYINHNLLHIDVTFDNTLTLDKKYICYDYFNLTDSQIVCDHIIREERIVSSKKEQDYYTLKKLVFSNYDEIKQYIKQCTKQRVEFVAFKIGKIPIEEKNIERLIKETIWYTPTVKSYKYSMNSQIKSVKIHIYYR